LVAGTLVPNEIERRDRLADKCLDLSKVALEQGDLDTFRRLFRNSYRLHLANLAAMRLANPEVFSCRLTTDPAFTQFVRDGLQCGGRDMLIDYGFEPQVPLIEKEDA
jgi:hypothetical protein